MWPSNRFKLSNTETYGCITHGVVLSVLRLFVVIFGWIHNIGITADMKDFGCDLITGKCIGLKIGAGHDS